MKLLNRLFLSVCILIVALCGAVLLFALNPGLTRSLSEKMYASDAGVWNESAGDGASQELDKAQDGQLSEDKTGQSTIEALLPDQDYVAPSQSNLTLPDQVHSLMGYVPVSGQEEAVESDIAQQLQLSLDTGAAGENLTFDGLMYPYYGMLGEELQALYRQIYANALECREVFAPIITVGRTDLKKAFEAVYNDHPELFWLETAYSCKYTKDDSCVEILLKYNETAEELEAAKERFEARAQVILAEAKKLSGLLEKETYVHDSLVSAVAYRKDAAMSQSAYSALVNNASVCAGYARAFQYLMQELGIPCYYCTGYSGEDHAWNIIKLGDTYCNVDVTWDDTGRGTYDYFNKSDSDYAKTHVRTGLSVNLPACNSPIYGNGVVSDSLSDYVNDDPQAPLTWPLEPWGKEEAREQEEAKRREESLKAAGLTKDDVLESLEDYYKDCLARITATQTNNVEFSSVVSQKLWEDSIQPAYSDKKYMKGYVEEALKKLEKDHFTIRLVLENLGGGYYRVYHIISLH